MYSILVVLQNLSIVRKENMASPIEQEERQEEERCAILVNPQYFFVFENENAI